MKIDDTVMDSLQSAIAKLGNQNAVAAEAGIPRTKPGLYIHRKVEDISDDNWSKLWPVLVKHAPALDAPEYVPRPLLRAWIAKHAASTSPVTTTGHCACDDIPELKRVCELWDKLPKDMKIVLMGDARVAIKLAEHATGKLQRAGSGG